MDVAEPTENRWSTCSEATRDLSSKNCVEHYTHIQHVAARCCGGGPSYCPAPQDKSCSGVLIHPSYILTLASCVEEFYRKAMPVKVSLGHVNNCPEHHASSTIVMHPGYGANGNSSEYNVALIKLETPSKHTPVQLHHTGTLGFTKCDGSSALLQIKPRIDQSGAPVRAAIRSVYPLSHDECSSYYEAVTTHPLSHKFMCGEDFQEQMWIKGTGRGSPLLVPWQPAATGYSLLGLGEPAVAGVSGPSTFLRTNEFLQWLLSVPEIGMKPAVGMSLEVKGLVLADGISVSIFNSVSDSLLPPMAHLDSACDASEEAYFDDYSGAMLLQISKEGCEDGCVASAQIQAQLSMLPSDCEAAFKVCVVDLHCKFACFVP